MTKKAKKQRGEAAAAPSAPEELSGSKGAEASEAEVTQVGEGVAQEVAELKDRLQRLGADYQNYQKRVQKELQQVRQWAKEDLVKGLLGVLDDFERTLANGGEAPDAGALLEGVRMVYDHLEKALEGAGLRRVTTEPGEAFDPGVHEALMQEESETVAPNCVVRELQCGYQMNERLLRPARVSVAKVAAGADESESEGGQEAQENDGGGEEQAE